MKRYELVEDLQTAVQRLVKRLFFSFDYFLHARLFFTKFRKNIYHFLREHFHQFVKERFVKTEGTPVTNGTAKDAAQNIIAIRVSWKDAVRN